MTAESKKRAFVDIKGDPKFADATDTISGGQTKTPISITVDSGKIRALHQIIVACRLRTSYKVKLGGDQVGSGRTGPGHIKDTFSWVPGRDSAATGTSVTVEISAQPNQPIDVPYEVYLQMAERSG